MSRKPNRYAQRCDGRRRAHQLLLVLLTAVIACSSPSITEPPPPGTEPPPELPDPDVRVTVNGATRHQTMIGFGGDIGPWHISGLTRTEQEQLVRAAVEGTGVNVARMNFVYHEGADANDFWGSNDNANPSAFRWQAFNFCTRPGMTCNDDWQWLVPLLKKYGMTGEYLGQIQGPRWNGFDGASTFNVDEMVENQLAALLHLRDDLGITLAWHAPFSEPGGGGINWPISPVQATNAVRSLGARLEANGFQIRMLIPDATNVRQSIDYAGAILADAQARRHVGAIGYHTYASRDGGESPNASWMALRTEIRNLARSHGLPVRMTEYVAASGLLERANHIFNELEHAHSATYHAQHIFATGDHTSPGPVRSQRGGIVYYITDAAGRLVEWGPTRYTGIAIGHYARFARPGSERIDVTSDDARVRVQAFVDAASNRLAIVAINNRAESRRVELTLAGGVTVSGLGEGMHTSESDGPDTFWTAADSVQLGGPARVQFIAPARSITSLSFTR